MKSVFRIIPATLICAATFGTAHAGERPRVAVLPFTAMAASEAECKKLRGRLAGLLKNLFDVRLIESKTTSKIVSRFCGKPEAWWDCLGKDESLFKLGKRLKAEVVVMGRLAAIGKRRVLKLRLADVPAGRVFAEVVNIPAGQENAVLTRFAHAHKKKFGGEPPPPPLPRPAPAVPAAPGQERAWYEKWEVWTIIGSVAAVAAGAVLFATMYSPSDDGGPWDFHRTLP
jgi:TolB-like protein